MSPVWTFYRADIDWSVAVS